MAWFAEFICAKADGSGASDPGPSPERGGDPSTGPPLSPRRRLWVAVIGLLLLHVSHPLTWGTPSPALWFPPLGLGLALVAWLGPRALGLVLADACLVLLQAWVVGVPTIGERLGLALAEALLSVAEVGVVWWGYRRLAKGSGGFIDPRSTILFLLFIPGLTVALFAVAHTLAAGVPDLNSFLLGVSAFWLSRALGLLVFAPPLLVLATPALVRRGFAIAEPADDSPSREILERGWHWGDGLEIGGLALGTAILGLLLVVAQRRGEVLGWGLCVLPLFLVGWASLRQGVRGGTLVAATGALVALSLACCLGRCEVDFLTVQGSLLAHCSVALLLGVFSSWIAANEARYRQVVSHIPVVLYSARVRPPSDPRARTRTVTIRFVSPASEQLLACRPEDLLGDYERWLQRVHPEDRELLWAAQAQLSRAQQPVTCEYRLAEETRSEDRGSRIEDRGSKIEDRASASVRWVRDTLVPLFGSDGQLEGWEGVVADITEQRMLADDLRRTTSMFHALVTYLPAGVFFVHAPSGRPILVNTRARQLLGQRENLAASLTQWAEVYRLYRHDGTPYPAEELPVCTALRRGVTSMRDDIVVHRPDGRRVPLITWAAPLDLSGRGRADAAVWVLEDLTALHQAEAAHRASEARLRTVIETMAEGLIVYDRTGQIVECNPAACAILGLTSEQLRGRSVRDPKWNYLCADGTPFPREEHPALVSLRTGQPVRNVILGVPLTAERTEDRGSRIEDRGSRKTTTDDTDDTDDTDKKEDKGTTPDALLDPRSSILDPRSSILDRQAPPAVRWLLVNAMPLTEGRDLQPARVVTTVTDLTAQRQAEQELQRAQRLDLVGRLASGIAHDFNNLLTVVITLADMARHQLPAEHTVREDLRRVVDAGEQAARLAGQLLAFSKQRRIITRQIDINQVVRQTLDLLRSTLPRSITVEPSLEDHELHVQADETQLQQVFMNLCLNARDAMPNGGRLEVRTEALPVTAGPSSGPIEWVRLSIHDSGQGMPENVRARIFDPFFSTKEHGTGLGLAVVQQIVESYGGRVEVWSHPGEGARFDVWLPRALVEVETARNN